MWDPEFLELMPLTLAWRSPTERSVTGKKTLGEPDEFRARLLETVEEVEDVEGETRRLAGTVWLPPAGVGGGPAVEPDPDGMLQLPGGTLVPITKRERVYDEDGVHHVKLTYG